MGEGGGWRVTTNHNHRTEQHRFAAATTGQSRAEIKRGPQDDWDGGRTTPAPRCPDTAGTLKALHRGTQEDERLGTMNAGLRALLHSDVIRQD